MTTTLLATHRREQLAALARRFGPRPNYMAFLDQHAPIGYRYRGVRHFEQISAQIQRAIDGDCDRIRIHMPPRHGKSETVTLRLPIYVLMHAKRDAKILLVCHTTKLARKFGRAIRNNLVRYGIKLAKDSKMATEFETEAGGRIVCTGIRTPPTGEGFDWIIFDDLYKSAKEASSETYREFVEDAYMESFITRGTPTAKIIMVFTRWHKFDLGGKLDELADSGNGDDFEVLSLRAIDESSGHQVALWPEGGWTLDKLHRKRKTMLLRSWEAQYQQNPAIPGGDFFSTDRIETIGLNDVPPGLPACRGWDVGYSLDGDYTVGAKIAGPDDHGHVYIVDVQRFRLKPGQRNSRMASVITMDGPECLQVLPRDPAAGADQVHNWERDFGTLTPVPLLKFVDIKSSKIALAEPFAVAMEAGMVKAVRAPWNLDYTEELDAFGEDSEGHDDQVDASSAAYNNLRRVATHY